MTDTPIISADGDNELVVEVDRADLLLVGPATNLVVTANLPAGSTATPGSGNPPTEIAFQYRSGRVSGVTFDSGETIGLDYTGNRLTSLTDNGDPFASIAYNSDGTFDQVVFVDPPPAQDGN